MKIRGREITDEFQRRKVESWARGWRSPEVRDRRARRRLVQRHQEASEAMTKGVLMKMGQDQAEVHGTLAYRLHAAGPKARKLIDAIITAPARLTVRQLHKETGFTLGFVRRCHRSRVFQELLADVIDAGFHGAKAKLQQQIVDDACVSIHAVPGTKTGAIVESRKQAAGVLNLTIEPPKAPERHEHAHAHIHMWAGYPDEAVEAYADGKEWDRDKWGPPPWEKS